MVGGDPSRRTHVSAVCNAGHLINLAKLQHLALLSKLHAPVVPPSAVYDEVVTQGTAGGHADAVLVAAAVADGALHVVQLGEAELPNGLRTAPLGKGERHAIGLALLQSTDFVFLDDVAARHHAQSLGLEVKGTLGILADAARTGLLNVEARDRVFLAVLNNPGIWLSEALVRLVWEELRQQTGGGEAGQR
jgi:uncharacterized protein